MSSARSRIRLGLAKRVQTQFGRSGKIKKYFRKVNTGGAPLNYFEPMLPWATWVDEGCSRHEEGSGFDTREDSLRLTLMLGLKADWTDELDEVIDLIELIKNDVQGLCIVGTGQTWMEYVSDDPFMVVKDEHSSEVWMIEFEARFTHAVTPLGN